MWYEQSADTLANASDARWILERYELPLSTASTTSLAPRFEKYVPLNKWIHVVEGRYGSRATFSVGELQPASLHFRANAMVNVRMRWHEELHSLYNRAYVEYVTWMMLGWVGTLTHFPHTLRCLSATLGDRINHQQAITAQDWADYGSLIVPQTDHFHVAHEVQTLFDRSNTFASRSTRATHRASLSTPFADPTIPDLAAAAFVDPATSDASTTRSSLHDDTAFADTYFSLWSDDADEAPAKRRRLISATLHFPPTPNYLSQTAIARPEDETATTPEDHIADMATSAWIDWTREQLRASMDQPLCISQRDTPVLQLSLERADLTLYAWMLQVGADTREAEMTSILFQTLFVLAAYQTACDFVHNDLHASNVMLRQTTDEWGYYEVSESARFRVPLFGWRVVLIDFGRASFRWKERWIASDDFSADMHGESSEQYNMDPFFDPTKPQVSYNRSFDFARLAYDLLTLFRGIMTQHFPAATLFLAQWFVDDFNESVARTADGSLRFPGFRLYRYLARHVHGLQPQRILERDRLFDGWRVDGTAFETPWSSLIEVRENRAPCNETLSLTSWKSSMPTRTSTPDVVSAERVCTIAETSGTRTCSTAGATPCSSMRSC